MAHMRVTRIDRERSGRSTQVERSLTTGSELGASKQGQRAGDVTPRHRRVTSPTIHVQAGRDKRVDAYMHVELRHTCDKFGRIQRGPEGPRYTALLQ